MKNSRVLWASVFFGVTLSVLNGCAGLVRQAAVYDLGKADEVSEGVFFHTKMLGDAGDVDLESCTLSLRDEAQGSVFEAPFVRSRGSYLIALPPGRYSGSRLRCRPFFRWDVENLFAGGFEVRAGQLSYAGVLILDFKDQGRTLTLRYGDRTESLQGLSKAVGFMHSSRRGSVISAYSGRLISAVMVQDGASGGIKIQATHLREQQKADLQPLYQTVTRCLNDPAFLRDQVKAGRLAIEGDCKPGSKTTVMAKALSSALLESFESCLKKSVETYACDHAVKIEIQF